MSSFFRNLLMIGLVFILSFIFIACNKTYTCSHSYYHRPLFISFIGFSPSDLSVLVLNKYENVNGTKGSLISSDTTFQPTLAFVGDTAYHSAIVDTVHPQSQYYRVEGVYSFSIVDSPFYYTIVVPNTNDKFEIYDIKRLADEVWKSKQECNVKGTFMFTYQFKSKGNFSYIFNPFPSDFCVGLIKS